MYSHFTSHFSFSILWDKEPLLLRSISFQCQDVSSSHFVKKFLQNLLKHSFHFLKQIRPNYWNISCRSRNAFTVMLSLRGHGLSFEMIQDCYVLLSALKNKKENKKKTSYIKNNGLGVGFQAPLSWSSVCF